MAGFWSWALAALEPLQYDPSLGFGGYVGVGRQGPYDANSTAFLDAVKTSNSTGVFKIPFYDISQPFPGQPMISNDGWSIRIAAVDLSFLPAASTPMVGYSLTLQAPDSLLETTPDGTKTVKADASWGMCMWNFGHPSLVNKTSWNNRDNRAPQPDRSCRGFIPDACIAAIEEAAASYSSYTVSESAYDTGSPFGSRVTCEALTPRDECAEYLYTNLRSKSGSRIPRFSQWGVPMRFLNGSITDQGGWEFATGHLDPVEHRSPQHLRDYWDSMVLNYWPVVTLVVNATYGLGRKIPSEMARMYCVAPNGVGTGKAFSFRGVVPAGGETGAKNSACAKGRLGWGWVSAVVLAALSVYV